MIIIEGADNTGKTTLAKKLIDKFPFLIMGEKKFTGPPKDKDEYVERIYNMFSPVDKNKKLFTVYDRCHVSEVVYGPILRGQSVINRREFYQLSQLALKHKPLVIYCFRSLEKILETYDEREQLEGTRENLESIIEAYNRIMVLEKPLGRPVLYTIDHHIPEFQDEWLFDIVVDYFRPHGVPIILLWRNKR